MFSKCPLISLVVICLGLLMSPQFCGQILAETIPFDYWYGRIIGRTQIQAVHDAYNGQYGQLTTSMKVGHGNDVSVNLGTLFDIVPTSQSNAFQVRFHRPKLSAMVRLSPRLRWQIDRLDLQESSDLETTTDETRFTQQSAFQSDQTIRLLHKDIEFDSSRSLYYYTTGMLLQPRNWNLDARVQLAASDLSERRQWPKYISQNTGAMLINRQSTRDSRLWLVNATLGYGISRKLQMMIGWLIGRQSNPGYQIEELFPITNLDSLVRRYEQESESVRRNYEIFVEPVFLLSQHHWASIRPSFLSHPSSTLRETMNLRETQGLEKTIDRGTSADRAYGLALNHTWIGRGSPIPLNQILDDQGDYYGHRFTTGTIRVSTSADLKLRRYRSESWREREGGFRFSFHPYESREDVLIATSEVTYYSRYNLDLSLKFSLDRRSSGGGQRISDAIYYHTQVHYFDLKLSYFSYRWDPSKRNEIGWGKIGDMDYLYGPLLRPRDWRASITITPPAERWTYRDPEESVFNFFKGESDDRWTMIYSSAVGVCDGVEMGLDVNYSQVVWRHNDDPYYRQEAREVDWAIGQRFRWQPGQRFRVDLSFSENYNYNDDVVYSGQSEHRGHEYSHTWSARVVYSILI